MKNAYIASALTLALGVSWAQDIASQVLGPLVRTAACVGHESNHVEGTIFNKTEGTIYGLYQIKIYADSLTTPKRRAADSI
jgi:hypothetical protein